MTVAAIITLTLAAINTGAAPHCRIEEKLTAHREGNEIVITATTVKRCKNTAKRRGITVQEPREQ